MRTTLFFALIALIAYAAHIYDNSPLDPKPYRTTFAELPATRPFVGLERFLDGQIKGPECITFDKEGLMYTGVVGGAIMRINTTTWKAEQYARLSPNLGDECLTEADVCGRALGMTFDEQGQLVLASTFGIQRVRKDGVIETLLTEVAGEPLRFANSLVVLRDGTIVFTDSTTKWTRSTWRYAFLEANYDGRMIRFHPSNPRGAQVIKRGLWFANGIALVPDESAVIYQELGAGNVHRLSLATLEDTLLISSFPGLLDNLHRSPRNTFLAAIPALHSGATKSLIQAAPFVRKAFCLFVPPRILNQLVPHFGAAMEFDESGKILNVWKSDGPVTVVTDITEHNGHFYLGGLENNYIGRAVAK